jgi:hypothetical protein
MPFLVLCCGNGRAHAFLSTARRVGTGGLTPSLVLLSGCGNGGAHAFLSTALRVWEQEGSRLP